eukprot:597774-Prymnesium_polylepis.1
MLRTPLPCPTSGAASPRAAPGAHPGCLPCLGREEKLSLLRDAKCLECLIRSNRTFFVGRLGMGAETEGACLASVRLRHRQLPSSSNLGKNFDEKFRQLLQMHNGVRTSDAQDAYEYSLCYAAAINASDMMVRFGTHNKNGAVVPLRSPSNDCAKHSSFQRGDALIAASGHNPGASLHYRILDPWLAPAAEASDDDALWWIRALQGKTVLLIHPFDQTIRSQIAKGNVALWQDIAERVIPSSTEFKFVRPPQNLGHGLQGEHSWKSSWRESYQNLVAAVDAAGHFDVAIMACGGLGMLIGAHLRATGRSSIYVGGSLQVCPRFEQ